MNSLCALRKFLANCALFAASALAGRITFAHAEPVSAGPVDPTLIEDWVAAKFIVRAPM